MNSLWRMISCAGGYAPILEDFPAGTQMKKRLMAVFSELAFAITGFLTTTGCLRWKNTLAGVCPPPTLLWRAMRPTAFLLMDLPNCLRMGAPTSAEGMVSDHI